jgi:hypothetical protein
MAKSKTRASTSVSAAPQNDQAHLGRNPFEKSRLREKGASNTSLVKDETPSSASASEWLFVKLPADTLVFAIKTTMLMKDSILRKRRTSSSH